MAIFAALWETIGGPLDLWSLPILAAIEAGGPIWWMMTQISGLDVEVEMFP